VECINYFVRVLWGIYPSKESERPRPVGNREAATRQLFEEGRIGR
jgi:hypothetical protein